MKLKNLSLSLANPLLWGVFIIYVFLSGYIISHHELWIDELHSWNIAKGSDSFFDLIKNRRYEGHPPVWYIILWTISKFTHNVEYIQVVHVIVADIIVFLILFFSPLPFLTRILIPFGYYFLYEYAALSRNYAIAILFIICICLILHKNFRYKIILYYLLLFLAANTHLIALLLAISIHIYFWLLQYEKNKKKTGLVTHMLIGGLVLLSALYFIVPPSEGEMNIHFFLDRWDFHQVTAVLQLPLRAFLPIPAWWVDNLWNTEFLLEAKNQFKFLKYVNPLIVVFLLGTIFYILRKNKKSLILFISNLALSFIVTITIFTLTSARYSGFIFIGFIVAYWLCFYERAIQKNNWFVNTLLIIQVFAGILIILKDIRQPFSNAYKVIGLLKEVPTGEKAVTDYWALNAISAYTNSSFYCIDMQKEMSFILWGEDIVEMQKRENRYCEGLNDFFQKEAINKLYMISTGSLQNLSKVDPLLLTSFQIKQVDKRDGAIEKGGNIYLYEISTIDP